MLPLYIHTHTYIHTVKDTGIVTESCFPCTHTYTHTHTVKDTGIVTESCFPYSAQKGKAAVCVRACTNGEPFIKYKAKDFFQLKTEVDMQKEIMTNGPVEAGFIVSVCLCRRLCVYIHR
jgi:hypothetical protein